MPLGFFLLYLKKPPNSSVFRGHLTKPTNPMARHRGDPKSGSWTARSKNLTAKFWAFCYLTPEKRSLEPLGAAQKPKYWASPDPLVPPKHLLIRFFSDHQTHHHPLRFPSIQFLQESCQLFTLLLSVDQPGEPMARWFNVGGLLLYAYHLSDEFTGRKFLG